MGAGFPDTVCQLDPAPDRFQPEQSLEPSQIELVFY